MVELSAGDSPGDPRRDCGGDTFNTAVYLARAGLDVGYLTRLGDDSASDEIVERMQLEGIDTSAVTRCAGREPGRYTIDNGPGGERRFTYARDRSPARELFRQVPRLPDLDLFYFTGITLAITREDLDKLLHLLEDLREKHCRIVFDPNYRSALWRDRDEARRHYQAVLPLCHTALPTLEDEAALWDISGAEQCRALFADHGIEEIIIKGDDLVTHAFLREETLERRASAVTAVDTTGAGDAFNAGYLAARLSGCDLDTAVTRAQQLASDVVQHRGAILPRA